MTDVHSPDTGRNKPGIWAPLRLSEMPPHVTSTDVSRGKYLPDATREGVALCLSGGGYRAALFHLGAVRRLNEVGALGRITTITGVSGGSILAAHLATSLGNGWPVPGGTVTDFDSLVATPFHAFCQRNIRTGPLLAGLAPWNLFRGHVAVQQLEREYARHLTSQALVELSAHPRFVFCATDMAYGVNWTFRRARSGSYMAGYADSALAGSVARAVAASSCFPPFFNPQPAGISPDRMTDGMDPPGAGRDERVRALGLSDGGLYDNMGLEPVWKDHAVLLVSEGGSTFEAGADRGLLWRLNRYIDVMGRQGGAQRKRWLISNFINGVVRGTYWGIGTDIADYEVSTTGYPKDLTKQAIAKIRTDLDRFTEAERFILENHGYLLADAAIRKYASFLAPDPMPEPTAPHPEWMDPDRARNALRQSADRKLPFGRGWPR